MGQTSVQPIDPTRTVARNGNPNSTPGSEPRSVDGLTCFVLVRSVASVRSLAVQLALGAGELRSELGTESLAELCQVLPDLWQLGAHGVIARRKTHARTREFSP
jgi:hypothetical protein